jgi:hypothetical protein
MAHKVKKLNKLEDEIKEIKEELLSLGDLRPGSLTEQFNTCGNPNCRCKEDSSARHGPYYQLSYTRNGQSKTEYIKKTHSATVKNQIDNYAKLQKLMHRWIDLSIEICRIKTNH